MSNLNICRICLRTGGKMYKYDEYQLKNYYEQVTAMKLREKDSLPKRFCYECAALLHKFHKFKEKCYNGQKILNNILWKGAITYESLNTIDRQSHNLKSHIDIITVSKRVRTRIYKHKQKHEVETQQPVLPPTENIEIDLQSECSFRDDYDDKEIVETKDLDIDKVITDDVKVAVDDKISSDDETLTNLSKKENDKNIIETKIDYDRMSSDDEKALIDIKKVNVDKKSNNNILLNKQIVTKKEKKKKNRESEENTNKRSKSRRGTSLDSNHWLKIYLTEEEAARDFKARGEDPKYLKAPYKCTDCFKGFSKQDMLDRHIKLRHVETVGPIECRFCRMRFKWKNILTSHMPRHYIIYKCLRCNLVFNLENSAVFHDDYHNGVIRKCEHCGKEFTHLSTYYTHLRTHRSEHVCSACGVSFVSATGLRLHRLNKHVGAAEQTQDGAKSDAQNDTYCERCNIKFDTRQAYDEHLFHSAMHAKGVEDLAEGTPALACSKERKRGPRPRRKPTTCSYCGKTFPTQAACMKHHHTEHPRTPFLPNERHICEICGMSLAAASVATHLNTHTRKRVFTCKTCGVQFNSKGSMNRHQVTHTGEKPFACSLCEKRFTQANSRQLHYKTVHLKEPYPKRNRKKKTDGVTLAADFRAESESESLSLDRWT